MFRRIGASVLLGIASAAVITSPTREYEIISSTADDGGIVRYTAISGGEKYFIKCSSSADCVAKLEEEFELLSRVQVGMPNAEEYFETVYEGTSMMCSSTGFVGVSLREYSTTSGLIDFGTLMILGSRMLDSVEAGHEVYKINHRDATARQWLLPQDDLNERPILSGFTQSRPLTKDPHGYHRIVELQQLVMTIRYLIDLDERFYRVRKIPSRDINIICPTIAACPGNLREIIEYVLSVDPNRGSVPKDMYDRLRQLFEIGRMIENQVSCEQVVRRNLNSVVGGGVAIHNPIPSPDGEWDYYIVNRIADSAVFEAVPFHRSGRQTAAQNVALHCNRGGVDRNMVHDEIHAKVVGTLNLPGDITCHVMEKLSPDLRSISREQGAVPFEFMARYGLRMLYIVERLHKFHGMAHRNLVAQNWAFRPRIHSIVLTRVVEEQRRRRTAYHRILDLQQLVLTIRYMLDLDESFYSVESLRTRDVDEICPPGLCPDAFKTLVVYVFSLDPEDGEVPSEVYAAIHQGLVAGLHGAPTVGVLRTEDGREYELLDRVERGGSDEITEYAGIMKRKGQESCNVTVICSAEDMGHDYMRHFDGESWKPLEYNYFRDPSVTSREVNCLVTERMGNFRLDGDGLPLAEIVPVVRRMLQITQKLHKEFVGKYLNPDSWRITERSHRLVFTDFIGMIRVNDDPTGDGRIKDIQSVVLMIRYLISPQVEFFSLRYTDGGRDIRSICPDEIVCPPGVRELIEYTMSLTSPITDDVYRIVGEGIYGLL
jgi:hypothetical protein